MTAKRVDQNQREIVEALRRVGASVEHIHMVGHGVPDLMVGYFSAATGRHITIAMEVKMPGGKLTKDELEWHYNWRGLACVVRSVDEALRAIGVEE